MTGCMIVTIIRYSGGDKMVGVTGVALDITDRYRVEEGLRESEVRFQTLAENIPGVIYLCHNDGRYSMVYTNSENI
jgi:PAS domain-containing protein